MVFLVYNDRGVDQMARILIVEDELMTAHGLAAMIKSINDKVDTTITGHAKEALERARNSCYDAFLIDIQLLDYSGFELAKEIREIDRYKLAPIVFITAVPIKELMAFKEIHCYDYIVKPFKEEEVITVLKTIINHGITKIRNIDLKLKQKGYSYIIKQDEIIYIESKNRKIFIETTNEQIELSTYTLGQILDKLADNFLRCHKGYAININCIEKIDKTNNNIYMKNIRRPIPIGRKYKELLEGRIYETG